MNKERKQKIIKILEGVRGHANAEKGYEPFLYDYENSLDAVLSVLKGERKKKWVIDNEEFTLEDFSSEWEEYRKRYYEEDHAQYSTSPPSPTLPELLDQGWEIVNPQITADGYMVMKEEMILSRPNNYKTKEEKK